MLKSQVAIKLDKQMDCNYICKHIQELINRYAEKGIDLSNYLLVCGLKEITESNQSLLLRIGYKDEQIL